MGTRVRTEPATLQQQHHHHPTPHPASSSQPYEFQQPTSLSSSRPQIYVRFEFGVSWSPSNPGCRHSITYQSGSGRSRHSQHRAIDIASSQQQRHSHRQQHLDPGRPSYRHEPSSRHHERGSSAPPSFGADIGTLEGGPALAYPPLTRPAPAGHSQSSSMQTVGRRQQDSSSWNVIEQAGSQPLPPARLMNALPTTPSLFRPGEGSLSRSDHPPFPSAVDYYPGHDVTSTSAYPPASTALHSFPSPLSPQTSHTVARFANNPTMVPIRTFTPDPGDSSSNGREGRGEDPTRVGELEALGSAMMTVDNGFEDQWWYQGQREAIMLPVARSSIITAAGDLITSRETPGAQDPEVRYHIEPIMDGGLGFGGLQQQQLAEYGSNTTTATSATFAQVFHSQPFSHPSASFPHNPYAEGASTPMRRSRSDEGTSELAIVYDTPLLDHTTSDLSGMVVSPMTETATPGLRNFPSLNRSLSTRSEELFF